MRKHITPPFVLSIVAIIIAIAGSATAATVITGREIANRSITAADISNNSITAKQIASRSITGGRIELRALHARLLARGTITGEEVKDRSLTAADFDGSIAGVPGPQGPAGPPGSTGVAVLTRVNATGSNGVAEASCPAGQRVVSGGGTVAVGTNHLVTSQSNAAGTGWRVLATTAAGSGAGVDVFASAFCSAEVTIAP